MKRRLERRLTPWATAVIALVSLTAQYPVAAGGDRQPEKITWYIPLQRAAELLTDRYAVPVTYEDPSLWLWDDGLDYTVRLSDGRDLFRVKEHTLTMPEEVSGELTAGRAPRLNLRVVTKVVESYNRENPGFPRYGVLESKLGFHIVPVEIPDETGKYIPAKNLLDTLVSVPLEQRTPSEHLIAICNAVAAASGRVFRVRPMAARVFDGYFAANGYFLPKMRSGRERPYMLFEWGIQNVKARDALIDLLERSSTTMRWVFGCELTGRVPESRPCGVVLDPLVVGGRIQSFDRCVNCRPVPTQ